MTETLPLRVLIADDHPLFRFGVGTMLKTMKNVEVVGEAADGNEVVALALQLAPDVILMDVHMPVINGIDATQQILAKLPEIRILVVTMFDDDASVFAAMRAGARGYILKDAEKADIVRAIEAVGRGEAIFSPTIATHLIQYFNTPPVPRAVFPTLTDREREILNLVADGYSNGDIARRLALTPKTVANYLSTIFGKLQVAGRAEAIIRARNAGLGTGEV